MSAQPHWEFSNQQRIERYEGDTLADRIRPHIEEIAARAAETETARTVPAENMRHIVNAGFIRALVPRAWGGDHIDLSEYCDGVRTLTKACPSTGWVASVLGIHPPALPHFHPDVQEKVWSGGADTVIGSSGTALMKAKLVDGGVLISGRGRWSSGCDYADWIMVGVRVPNAADPHYPERSYRDHMFFAHHSQYDIDDTWYSTGMRGTGSKDLVFRELFVPTEHLEPIDGLNFGWTRGEGTVDGWMCSAPFSAIFTTFLPAVALGCADGMLEQFQKRQRMRKNAYTRAKGILNPAGHMRLAESVHELESLSVYFKHLLDELQEYGERKERLTQSAFMELQSKWPFITDRAVNVIDRLFKGAGSSAIADFNAMQRYWRDGTTCRLHTGSDYDINLQQHGRSLLGLMPTPDL
ncbi:MAG: acyl-CoA dehydrogenase family protein [Gammaproteobacteria bacterium]|nr:acyl-CoA dehydrogenase family protein [Gammaproteobacteria bacterium]MDD9963349.1 acyl-CoA dehydrogenase family protein [Gammaproteobacteria bacterium]MDE0272486.1 acyl-CoA dehydrogenase family protein [Gammaproteobacteria bacterium]